MSVPSDLNCPKQLSILISPEFSGLAGFVYFASQSVSSSLRHLELVFLPQDKRLQAGFFQCFLEPLSKTLSLKISCDSALNINPLEGEGKLVFLLPQACSVVADELQLEVSDDVQAVLDRYLENGAVLWEEGIECYLKQYSSLCFGEDFVHHPIELERFLRALTHSELSLQTCIQVLHCLENKALTQLTPQLRAQLESTIRSLYLQSEDWSAHLTLALMGRKMQFLEMCHLEKCPLFYACALVPVVREPEKFFEVLPAVENDTIAIVLPTYNRCSLLKKAVEAILKQSYSYWKLYLGNDGSSDDTAEYCRALVEQYPEQVFYLHKAQNSGATDTLQQLMEQVTEEFLVYCSDDHIMHMNFLALCHQAYQKYPWIAMAAGSLTIKNLDTGHVLQHGSYYPSTCIVDNRKELQRAGLICPSGPACVYRKSLLRKWAPYDVWFQPHGLQFAGWDYLLNNKLLANYEVAYVSDTVMTMLDAAHTNSKLKDHSFELLYLLRQLIQDYNLKFGSNTYPAQIAKQFFAVCHQTILNSFNQVLSQSETGQEFEKQNQALQAGCKSFVEINQWINQAVSENERILIDLHNPYR